jgi:hypothetical protein
MNCATIDRRTGKWCRNPATITEIFSGLKVTLCSQCALDEYNKGLTKKPALSSRLSLREDLPVQAPTEAQCADIESKIGKRKN